MRGWATLVGLAIGLLATAGLGAEPDFAALGVRRYDPPKPAPAFVLPDLQGRTIRLEDLRGKVTLLYFWTTWWPDCREELPSVDTLYADYKHLGFQVFLISFQEDPEVVRRTVRDRGYVAPVLLDRSGDVAGKSYGVWGPPTAYFVDRQGRLLGRVAGARDWGSAAARRLVEALLEVSPR